MGRKSAYKEEYAEEAYRLCLLGAKDTELAETFGVSEQTLNTWKKKHPEFLESLRRGKVIADSNVAQSLYEKALTGDTSACIFWLKNRRKQSWRDRWEDVEDTGQDINDIDVFSYDE